MFVISLLPIADPLAKHLGTRASRTPEQRLRALLKAALRSLGLKCVRITTPGPASADVRPGA